MNDKGRICSHGIRATEPAGIAMLVTAACMAVFLALGAPRFSTNDDTAMMLQAAGVSTVAQATEYLLFSHVWIGAALKALYGAVPSCPWYACYLVAVLFAAHAALLYVALRRWGCWRGLAAFGLYMALIGGQFLMQLQFTVAACMVSAAGIALIFCASSGVSRRRVAAECAAGAALLLLGGMIRWDSLLLAAAVLSPALLMDAAWRCRREALRRGGLLAMALLLAWGLMQYDRARVRSGEGTGGYREFNDLLCRFVDDQMLDPARPAEIAPALARAGWSQNDYEMLLRYAFADTNVFTADAFRAALRDVPGRKPVPPAAVVRELQAVLRSPWVLNAGLAALAAAFLVWGRRGWLGLGLVLAAILALCAYLVLFRKAPPDRVYWPMFAVAAWVPLLTGEGGSRPAMRGGRPRALLALLIAAALLVRVRWAAASYAWQSRENRQEQQWLRDTLGRMNPDPGQLYVTWGASFPWVRLAPFGSLDPLRPFHAFALGTEQATAAGRAVLQIRGIKDLFREMPRRPEVLLVIRDGRMLELYRTYAREHHGIGIEADTVFSAGYFDVLRLRAAAPDGAGASRPPAGGG